MAINREFTLRRCNAFRDIQTMMVFDTQAQQLSTINELGCIISSKSHLG